MKCKQVKLLETCTQALNSFFGWKNFVSILVFVSIIVFVSILVFVSMKGYLRPHQCLVLTNDSSPWHLITMAPRLLPTTKQLKTLQNSMIFNFQEQ